MTKSVPLWGNPPPFGKKLPPLRIVKIRPPFEKNPGSATLFYMIGTYFTRDIVWNMVRDGGVVTITNAAALDNVPHDVAVRQQHLRYQKNQNAVLEPRTGML